MARAKAAEAKAKAAGPFHDRTIPKIAERLGIPEYQLRRAVAHGDVETRRWAGRQWIAPAEEERLRAILEDVRAADARYQSKGRKQRERSSAASAA
jgi:hypothetical protein